MVKAIQVTMYVDEITGKQYKKLETAKRAELKSKNIKSLNEISIKYGFKETLKFGRTYLPMELFLRWIQETNDKIYNESDDKIKDQLTYYAVSNFVRSWESYDNKYLEKEAESIYNILSEKLKESSLSTVHYYVDNQFVFEEKTTVKLPFNSTLEQFNSSTKFKYKEEQKDNILKVYYKKLTDKSIDEKYQALKLADVEKWQVFKNELQNFIDDRISDIKLTDEEEFEALEYGGVDNWSGYDYAIELAEEDGDDWSDLSDSEKLNYLNAAGVDNWSYCYDAIQEYKQNYKIDDLEEISESEFVELFESIKNKTEWNNYSVYIEKLYGELK